MGRAGDAPETSKNEAIIVISKLTGTKEGDWVVQTQEKLELQKGHCPQREKPLKELPIRTLVMHRAWGCGYKYPG